MLSGGVESLGLRAARSIQAITVPLFMHQDGLMSQRRFYLTTATMPVIRLSEPRVHNPEGVAPLSVAFGVFLLSVGALGLSFSGHQFADQARFIQHPYAPTLAEAGEMMTMPGLLGGAAALAFGVYLWMHRKDHQKP